MISVQNPGNIIRKNGSRPGISMSCVSLRGGRAAIEPEIRNDFIVRMAQLGVAAIFVTNRCRCIRDIRRLVSLSRDYPNAYEQFRNERSRCVHTRLSDEDIDYLAWAVKRAAPRSYSRDEHVFAQKK